MARKPPTARDIERAIDEAQNATVGARSDVTRWVAAGPVSEYADRQQVEHLLAEPQARYTAALRIIRDKFLDEDPRLYPLPPTPLHPGVA